MKCVVVGASGFVGSNLTKALLEKGYSVKALCRSSIPELVAHGAEHVPFDLASAAVSDLSFFSDVDEVYLVAAKVAMWGDYKDFYATNVLGTKKILKACQDFGVTRLIFTSSPSVIADGKHLRGVTESYPYPKRYVAHYPATKAFAERLLLASHNVKGVQTVSLRPHLIFGPGDTSLTPAVIKAAKSGNLVRIGSQETVTDFCFIEDCVRAHILAAEWMRRDSANGGRAFFISQGEPYSFWNWVNKVLEHNGIGPITKQVPYKVAYGVAALREIKALILKQEPSLTRFLVKELGTDHYFSIEAAQSLLGYKPLHSIDEALEKTFQKPAQKKCAA
jgi:2-alkyl-3-oxoalkanoate reductase